MILDVIHTPRSDREGVVTITKVAMNLNVATNNLRAERGAGGGGGEGKGRGE